MKRVHIAFSSVVALALLLGAAGASNLAAFGQQAPLLVPEQGTLETEDVMFNNKKRYSWGTYEIQKVIPDGDRHWKVGYTDHDGKKQVAKYQDHPPPKIGGMTFVETFEWLDKDGNVEDRRDLARFAIDYRKQSKK